MAAIPASFCDLFEIGGRVVESTESGADAPVDALARKYLGNDTYPFRQPGEVRILFKVLPTRVHGHAA